MSYRTALEPELAAHAAEKGAERVTLERVKSLQRNAQYHNFPYSTVTVCCLTLTNGYQVIGQSACADFKSFSAELGRKLAYEDAERQIWALEGYALRNKLTGA